MMEKIVAALLCAVLTGCASLAAESRPISSRDHLQVDWTPNSTEITKGVQATEASCAKVEDAVWADAGASGSECIRFWKSMGPASDWTRVVVFFHGDVWTGAEVASAYLHTTAKRQQELANEWSARIGAPYIFVGRPGTFGSSGDHMQRRRKAESEILSAALDALKKRLSIKELSIAGQSGGGHVVAALLVTRADVICAVPASAVSSPRARWIIRGRKGDSTGYADSYEPTEFLAKEGKHSGLRLFVVGSPEDTNVYWTSQLLLPGRAKTLGIPTMVLTGTGSGAAKHGMSNSARLVAGWCNSGLTDEQILERSKAGLNG
jgi:pimeloyl-ACP methyl ester carboxylesterase